MKIFLKILLCNASFISIILVGIGTFDDAFRIQYDSTNPIEFLINSVKYFILWTLPYWWFKILLLAAVLTLIIRMLGNLCKSVREK